MANLRMCLFFCYSDLTSLLSLLYLLFSSLLPFAKILQNLVLSFKIPHEQCVERGLNNIEKSFKRPLHGERACFRGSEHILQEIQEERGRP